MTNLQNFRGRGDKFVNICEEILRIMGTMAFEWSSDPVITQNFGMCILPTVGLQI